MADLSKKRFHRTLPPNLYFWRDKSGNEIDAVMEERSHLIPIEIKSGSTITSELFDNLIKWNKIAGSSSEQGYIIYSGHQEQKRLQGHVLPWNLI